MLGNVLKLHTVAPKCILSLVPHALNDRQHRGNSLGVQRTTTMGKDLRHGRPAQCARRHGWSAGADVGMQGVGKRTRVVVAMRASAARLLCSQAMCDVH